MVIKIKIELDRLFIQVDLSKIGFKLAKEEWVSLDENHAEFNKHKLSIKFIDKLKSVSFFEIRESIPDVFLEKKDTSSFIGKKDVDQKTDRLPDLIDPFSDINILSSFNLFKDNIKRMIIFKQKLLSELPICNEMLVKISNKAVVYRRKICYSKRGLFIGLSPKEIPHLQSYEVTIFFSKYAVKSSNQRLKYKMGLLDKNILTIHNDNDLEGNAFYYVDKEAKHQNELKAIAKSDMLDHLEQMRDQ